MQPIVTLTTDFGLSDHYVGAMKGVILQHAPTAQIVDITHASRAFCLLSAAYAIDQAAPFFPPSTIHVVVVDPGVGTARKALLVEAGGYRFLAPDNGILSLILGRFPDAVFRELTNPALFHQPVSSTFHGRDIFASVAAHLAGGDALPEDVGPAVNKIVLLPDLIPTRNPDNTWHGVVLSIDHFGNIITNFPTHHLSSPGVIVRITGHCIAAIYPAFGHAPPHVCFAYQGSSGYLEVGINQESAAAKLNARPGTPVHLMFSGCP